MTPKQLWRSLQTIQGGGNIARWFCVLNVRKAYLDETGIHDPSISCIIAGFLGTDEQWDIFDGEWKKGLGKRKSLHMKDLRWSKPERISPLLGRLGPIPEQCGLERIHGIVRGKDYDDLVPTSPIIRLILSPYMMAMQPCIFQTMRHVPSHETVHFIFERQDRYSPLAQFPQAFYGDQFKTPDGQPRLTITYVEKGFTPRTEPGDYLASEMAQCEIDNKSFKADAGRSILGDTMMIGARLKRSQIREIVARGNMLMDADPRIRALGNMWLNAKRKQNEKS
jgi:hypothetical protein